MAKRNNTISSTILYVTMWANEPYEVIWIGSGEKTIVKLIIKQNNFCFSVRITFLQQLITSICLIMFDSSGVSLGIYCPQCVFMVIFLVELFFFLFFLFQAIVNLRDLILLYLENEHNWLNIGTQQRKLTRL